MTNAAVEERPTTQASSEAANVQASEDQQVTAQDDAVQQETEGQTEQQQTQTTQTREQRVAALAEAERAEAIEEGRTQALSELKGNEQALQREQQRQKLRNTYVTEMQGLDSLLSPVSDGMGNERQLSVQEVVTRAKNALNNLNKSAVDSVAEQVKDVAYAILPEDAKESFTKLTEGRDVGLDEYLNIWAETAATHTKAFKDSVKSMSLEDAAKASSKIKRELEQAKLESFDEGREQGRLDPAGTSPDGGRAGQRTAPGTKSYIELEDAYGRGELTKAEETQYLQMRDARRKSS